MRNENEQPTIRPGQKKGYTKATKAVIAQRIECARLLIHCGYEKSEIHRIFREFYAVEWRQTDRYLHMALAHTRAHGDFKLSQAFHPRRTPKLTSFELPLAIAGIVPVSCLCLPLTCLCHAVYPLFSR